MEQWKLDPFGFRKVREGAVILIAVFNVDNNRVEGGETECDKLHQFLSENLRTSNLVQLG